MVWQDADATEITRVSDMCRRGQTGKGDRQTVVAEDQPPMTDIKFGHGSIFKEGQTMEIPERVRNVIVESVNLANPVHLRSLLATLDSLGSGLPCRRCGRWQSLQRVIDRLGHDEGGPFIEMYTVRPAQFVSIQRDWQPTILLRESGVNDRPGRLH